MVKLFNRSLDTNITVISFYQETFCDDPTLPEAVLRCSSGSVLPDTERHFYEARDDYILGRRSTPRHQDFVFYDHACLFSFVLK